MNASVEISLYPLHQNFISVIKDFIARLHTYPELKVETHTMSTQIFGNYETIMRVITVELQPVYESNKAVAVVKIIGKPEVI
ncbi:MAG: hypothetical protein LWX56_15340 [Ignavibacteria bacterium]|nr:hypothetical protein [Ignavibacteria bacterium]